METSSDPKVQAFLEKIFQSDQDKYQIVTELRRIVFAHFPKVNERIMYGGILFSNEEDFGGIFVYSQHVTFEFGEGYKLNDPDKHLEGKGKFRRHLKFRSLHPEGFERLEFFVGQIKAWGE